MYMINCITNCQCHYKRVKIHPCRVNCEDSEQVDTKQITFSSDEMCKCLSQSYIKACMQLLSLVCNSGFTAFGLLHGAPKK